MKSDCKQESLLVWAGGELLQVVASWTFFEFTPAIRVLAHAGRSGVALIDRGLKQSQEDSEDTSM